MRNESNDRCLDHFQESVNDTAPSAKRPSRYAGIRMIALALCCSLLGGAADAGGMAYLGRWQDPGRQIDISANAEEHPYDVTTVAMTSSRREMSCSEVYETNVNSVAGITTSITTTNSFGVRTQAASGSGFILTENGYILTNHHVIEGAASITATMYDGTSYTAELIGFDESNDLAVLKVNASGLAAVTIGDSGNLKVRSSVAAIGNPLGELTFSLTHGVISALDRMVTLSSKTTMDLIQTDCAINSGNSGGPLFNLYGEVIGITNTKYSSNSSGEASVDNIGFAIPINSILEIVRSIIDHGYIVKPYIGISVC